MPIRPLSLALAVAIVVHCLGARVGAQPLRRPQAVAISTSGLWAFTANRDSGSVSVLDLTTQTLHTEIRIGGRPTSVVCLPGESRILVADASTDQVLLVNKGASGGWEVTKRVPVPRDPQRLLLSASGNRVFVSSRWARAITSLAIEPNSVKEVSRGTVPFEPLEMVMHDQAGQLVVASSFDAQLALLDSDSLQVQAHRRLLGHNVRGLALTGSPPQLWLAQQSLNPIAHSTRDDVHWGNMISNQLVSIPLSSLQKPPPNDAAVLQGRVFSLGEPGNAAGDPGCVCVHHDGRFAVTLSGVHQLVVGKLDHVETWTRVDVGMRPVSVAFTPTGKLLAANMFSDSVSVLHMEDWRADPAIQLGPNAPIDEIALGEMLFFDARLSHDGWMSCHSCHSDGHSNGQLNDNLSDGTFGAAKRVLSLRGVADTRPWGWLGNVSSLQEQVRSSIKNTMQGSDLTVDQVENLAAFITSLEPPPALHPNQEVTSTAGRALFENLGCARCHAPPTLTTARAYDVELHDQSGNGPSTHPRYVVWDGAARFFTTAEPIRYKMY